MLYVMFSEGVGHEMCFTHRHCSCDRSTSKTCKKWQNSFELNCMLKYLFLYLFFNIKKYILRVRGLCPEGILS